MQKVKQGALWILWIYGVVLEWPILERLFVQLWNKDDMAVIRLSCSSVALFANTYSRVLEMPSTIVPLGADCPLLLVTREMAAPCSFCIVTGEMATMCSFCMVTGELATLFLLHSYWGTGCPVPSTRSLGKWLLCLPSTWSLGKWLYCVLHGQSLGKSLLAVRFTFVHNPWTGP